MKVLQVGELKANFSKIIDEVKHGEEVTISYGRRHEKVAVIIPYSKYQNKPERTLGILKNKASCKISDSFKIGDDELLTSFS
ncbi:MAG: type II toxin-antitoxin system Phd/YefM family antitoxin [Leptospirales bacterium]